MRISSLFYVIGPSGAGKDTLLTYARQHIPEQMPVLFAHRYITRPATAGGENHVYITRPEFNLRKSRNLFAMAWESHGNHYGIGKEINYWMASGCTVVVNGSREYLPEATSLYPGLQVILIEVSPEELVKRLLSRRREADEEVKKRLARASQFQDICHPSLIRINNDQNIEQSGQQLIELLANACAVS